MAMLENTRSLHLPFFYYHVLSPFLLIKVHNHSRLRNYIGELALRNEKQICVIKMDERAWSLNILPLKFTWQPTTDELNYLRQLVLIRMQCQLAIQTEQYDSSRPSMIIDQFLYQGDVKHASNEGLLEELNIQSIVNMNDCQLDPTIVNQRHVLWINIEDDIYTDIDQYFETTNKFLQSSKTKQKNVLVHCQMGVSRSSTIVLAYLMK